MNRVSSIVWFVLSQFIVLCLLLCVYKVAIEVYPTKPATLTHVHKNLYLDRNLNEFYEIQIDEAVGRWTVATNHIAEFDVIRLPVKNMDTVRNDPDAIVVTVESEDHPDIILLDKENKNSTVAFCNVRAPIPILAWVDGRLDDANFEKVMLHELGHAMSLEHSPEDATGIDQIMYHTTDLMANGITDADLKQFCTIYHCDASKLKHEEESLHL